MKKGIICFVLILAMAALLSGCGGGDGSGSSGTISMNITDAKPVLPVDGIESVTITFDEVSVHKSGGGWITLPTATQPYTIDLYQFSFENGTKTQFVPPVQLESGKYTQVRIGVTTGTIRINGVDYDLVIPSENLKTDKNFEFEVREARAVDLTVDFDLSQSIVQTAPDTYKLKPVLHIVGTSVAATIQGTITFGPATQATVIVYWDKDGDGIFDDPNAQNPDNPDEEYTRILVLDTETPPFKIFWLVPNEGYFVHVLLGDPNNPDITEEYVYLTPGETFTLEGGSPI